MPNIGVPELLILLVILLLIFGPKRLPGLGRQLGSGMREFKDSITGKSGGEDEDEDEDAEEPLRTLTPPPTSPVDPANVRETAAPVAAERRDADPPAA
jgi:sec-independent protein translocase protein TatA